MLLTGKAGQEDAPVLNSYKIKIEKEHSQKQTKRAESCYGNVLRGEFYNSTALRRTSANAFATGGREMIRMVIMPSAKM